MKAGGYLYAIAAEGTPFIKIGCTKNIDHRLKDLQVAHPGPLRLLAMVHVATDMQRIERQVHTFLAEHWYRGEWFQMSIDVVQLEALVVRAGAVVDQTPVTMRMQVQQRRKRGLTQYMVDAAQCPPTGEKWLPDDSLSGFGIRLRANGRKIYSFRYRLPTGAMRRASFGPTTVLNVDQARVLACNLLLKLYPDD